MKNTVSIEIDAPPARVFHMIYDSEQLKRWLPHLIEDEQLTTTEEVVGSTFRQVYLENGRRMEMEGEVIAFDQDKYLACEIRGKMFDLLTDFSLEPVGNGTRVTQNSEVVFKSLPMKLMGVLMKPLMKKAGAKQAEEQFAKLKELAESDD